MWLAYLFLVTLLLFLNSVENHFMLLILFSSFGTYSKLVAKKKKKKYFALTFWPVREPLPKTLTSSIITHETLEGCSHGSSVLPLTTQLNNHLLIEGQVFQGTTCSRGLWFFQTEPMNPMENGPMFASFVPSLCFQGFVVR